MFFCGISSANKYTMSILNKIKRGGAALPPRIILSGPEGIGKSTFAAGAPNPVFIAQESGLTGLDHIDRITPESFADVTGAVEELISADHKYQSVVIDTTDWLERSIHQFICGRDKQPGVEGYGFGKGYKIAEQELVLLLNKLDALRDRRNMFIILLSHVQIRTFQDPSGETWDRYEMKGHKGFCGILREWPDACLFAVYEVFKQKERGSNVERTIGGGRIIHTQWSPAWDAKNRLALPETIDLSWEAFSESYEANRPDKLREQFRALLKSANLTDEVRKKWETTPVDSLAPERLKAGIEKLTKLQK
jgi:hypothetical protein